MKLKDLKGKSILVLGVGREGLSVLRFLEKNFPDKKIDIADRRIIGDLPKNTGKTFFGSDYLDYLSNYDVVIKSPGIPYFEEIRSAKGNKKITSSTALFLQNCKGKVIGVTGTKGKSTTSVLIYEVLKNGGLKTYLIGNIGIPALDYLEKDSKDTVFVYELSSFQLEDLDVSPDIAVITNIYPEHLDHHGKFSVYVEAKKNIARFQKETDYLIYNEDSPQVKFIAKDSKAQKLPYSKQSKQTIVELIHKDALPLLGEFNILNTMPAVIIGKLFEIPDKEIEEAIINFKPLPHRLEYVGEFWGIRFYNDSLSTIPQATAAALSALGKNVETLITGGFDRGIDYSLLGPAIVSAKIKNLILFPSTGERIWEAVEKVKSKKLKVKSFNVSSMEEAVELAYKYTSPGKIVLLSPASSSFNMFKDYADRGSQFKKYVISFRH